MKWSVALSFLYAVGFIYTPICEGQDVKSLPVLRVYLGEGADRAIAKSTVSVKFPDFFGPGHQKLDVSGFSATENYDFIYDDSSHGFTVHDLAFINLTTEASRVSIIEVGAAPASTIEDAIARCETLTATIDRSGWKRGADYGIFNPYTKKKYTALSEVKDEIQSGGDIKQIGVGNWYFDDKMIYIRIRNLVALSISTNKQYAFAVELSISYTRASPPWSNVWKTLAPHARSKRRE